MSPRHSDKMSQVSLALRTFGHFVAHISPELRKILKTATFTLGMNILTVTRVKNDSEIVF